MGLISNKYKNISSSFIGKASYLRLNVVQSFDNSLLSISTHMTSAITILIFLFRRSKTRRQLQCEVYWNLCHFESERQWIVRRSHPTNPIEGRTKQSSL